MEPPLCKICEPPRRHWSSEPHHVNERPAKSAGDTLVADKAAPKAKAPAEKAETARDTLLRVSKERIVAKRQPKPRMVVQRPVEAAPDLTTRGTPRKRAPKGTFDKTAYQRELMRRKRAEKAK